MTRRSARIETVEGKLDGAPHVSDSDLDVERARTLVEDEKRPAAAVADRYEVAVADVYAALAYAHRCGDRTAAGTDTDEAPVGTDTDRERRRKTNPVETDRLLSMALDELDDVFYVYDADRRLVCWNRRLGDLFDLSDDELAGMRPEEFFLEADRERIREAVAEAVETGETVVEAAAETTEGEVVFQLSGRLLVDDDGTVLGLSGIGRDVTRQRDAERRLERQNERLRTFASTVSHDLRNPLAVSKGFLELERAERDTENLTDVSAAIERMERIVDDVLSVARQGRDATDPEPVSLATVAEAAWSTTGTENATLTVRTERILDADEERLRRLLENLFRNAVEHGSTDAREATASGGDERERAPVEIVVEDTAEGFAVEDDGVGIDAEDRDSVFKSGFSGAATGSGLGLAIVRTLAEAHGWTVAVGESDDGGARFEFELGENA